MKEYIVEFYTTCYSVTDCCNHIIAKEGISVRPNALRGAVTLFLKEAGVMEKQTGSKINTFRQKKIRNTMSSRYGVINAGQMPGNGFSRLNSIPYKKLKLHDDITAYKKAVNDISWRVVNGIKKRDGHLPSTCYYTGITFNDNVLPEVNPNDPFKRTVDHKISIVNCFLSGLPVEKAASEENLVFCLRVVNTIKGQLDEGDFRRSLLPNLIQRLHYES
jgi:hypothetical protein